MPKIPGVPHLKAVRALEKAGFRVAREGKHIVMSDGRRILMTVPAIPPCRLIAHRVASTLQRPAMGPLGPPSGRARAGPARLKFL